MEEYATVLNFNSIKVQLELMKNLLVTSLWRNFNSIKVQLEHGRKRKGYAYFIFQFHKGTIRTEVQSHQRRSRSYFNSIKVQLELLSIL